LTPGQEVDLSLQFQPGASQGGVPPTWYTTRIFSGTPAPGAGFSAVTLTSVPSGASITLTGVGCAPGTYITPASLTWTSASCTAAFADPQTIGGIKYSFQSSTVNGSSSSHTNPLLVNSGTGNLTVNAIYSAFTGTSSGTATHFSV